MISWQKHITLFILSLITFIDWVGFGLVYPMFSAMLFEDGYLLSSANATDLQRGIWLGVLLSAMPIAQFFFSPIAGALSDKKGRRPLLQFTLLLTIFGYVFSFFAAKSQNIFLLILARLAIGIGAGNVAVISASLADISSEKDRVKNYGILNMACGIGFSLGPYFGGKLSSSEVLGGFAAPFLVAAIVSIASLLLVQFLYKETNLNLRAVDLTLFKGAQNFLKAFKSTSLKYLFSCAFIFCFGWSFFWEFIPVFCIKQHDLNPLQIGTFYAYAACFYAVSCGMIVRKVSNFLKPQGMYLFGLIGLGTSISLIIIDPRYSSLWLFIPMQQIMMSFLFPTASAMVSMSVDKNTQGETLGILASVNSSAFAFSPLISGFVVGASHWSPIWAGSISMFFAALLFYHGCIKNKYTLNSLFLSAKTDENLDV